jgi:aminopeptidase N
MTLQQLRLAVGDDDFFRILRRWAAIHAGGNVTTDQFIALAERISDQDLDELFTTWLFTPGKPKLPTATASRSAALSQLDTQRRVAASRTLRR